MQDTTTPLPNMTTMSASDLGNQAVQALNSPEVTTAQNAVNTAQGAYNTQATDQATLPQLLENSLTSNLDNPNDPNRQNTQTDLATLLTAISNPSHAISTAEGAVPGAILSPGAQDQAMAEQVGRAGSALSMDNTILGARGAGITGLVGMFGNVMASRTQQLLNAVQLAQNNRDSIWQKAQALGSMAMNFSQLKEQMSEFNKNYGLESAKLAEQKSEFGQNLAFQKQTNPLLQATASRQKIGGDAKNYNSFDAWYGAHADDPALQGMQKQDLYEMYKSNGGKGDISLGLQRTTGVQTGNILQDLQANPFSAAGEGMGGLIHTGAQASGILGLLKHVGLLGGPEAAGEAVSSEGIGILPMLMNAGKGIAGLLGDILPAL